MMGFMSRRATIFLRIPKQKPFRRSISSCGSARPNRKKSCLGGITHPNATLDGNNVCMDQSYQWKRFVRPNSTMTPTCNGAESNHESDGMENESLSLDEGYSVAIDDDGSSISITFRSNITENHADYNSDCADAPSTTSNSWNFSSALLWVNDPKSIHASSGQRMRTLGQYSRKLAIVDVRIYSANDTTMKVLHSVPPLGSLHSRGLIDPNADRYRTLQEDRTLLELKWSDDQESTFDLDWLIDHANHNRIGQTKAKNPIDAEHLANTIYSINGDALDCKTENATTNSTTRVTKDIAIGANDNPSATSIARFDYRDILQNEDTLFEGMQEVFEHGAILVQNAPNTEDTECNERTPSLSALESIVGDLGRRFSGGSLSHGSLYGDIFHVQSKENAENIAYTNEALPPHQDLVYYESKPFLQLLHCATNSNNNNNGDDDDDDGMERIVGGESILIDAMAAAEELRRISPDLFAILCRTEATFVKERHDSDMVSPKPHIVVDPAYGQVVEVNWSPPFEGPLQRHPRIPVEDYILAYQAIECMLDDKLNDGRNDHHSTLLSEHLESALRDYARAYTKEYSLQKGDVIVFNNQRMLHGRRSFRSFGGIQRHLIGCYTDATDTLSRYRQLLRERRSKSGGGYGKRNPGSGYRWM